MKTTKLILMIATMAALASADAVAGDRFLSPRAKANQIPTVASATEDKLDRSLPTGSPKGRETAQSFRKVSGTTGDKIDRSLAALSPKARELLGTRANEFQVAPVK